jgi:hypothetical protein
MHRALAFKELRETAWLAALAAACLMFFVVDIMGYEIHFERLQISSLHALQPSYGQPPPFLHPELPVLLATVGIPFALFLGFRQSLGESYRGLWQFLLHLPLARGSIIASKLAVGTGLLLAGLGVPLVVYAIWAAIPGTHASPFEWWMTGHAWRIVCGMTMAYLAAFLCGIRAARWHGSRLLPLVPAGAGLLFVCVTSWWPTAGWITIAVIDAALVAAVLRCTDERDYH